MPTELPLFLGADGGQSHSLAILADHEGRVLGVGRAGSCNHFNEPGGPERFRAALTQIISGAFAQAGRPLQPLASACFGLTGAWDHAPAVVRAILPVERLVAVEDTVTAQAGAFAAGPGIVLIAGTGSVAYGKAERGKIGRAGGWGYLMGDEGSGYDIGLQALRAAAQAYDGRGPATLLVDHIPAHFGLPNLEAVQEAVYAGRLNRAEIAGLARLTARLAGAPENDPVARVIFDRAGEALAVTVLAVAKQLDGSSLPVSPVGGVFKAGALILDPFSRHLRGRLPQTMIQPPRYPQVVGALLLALQEAGYPLDQPLFERLDRAVVEFNLADSEGLRD